MNERLNVELVDKLICERGLRLGFVCKQIGLGTTAGTLLLNRGVLPANEKRKISSLGKLARLLGVEVRQILQRLEVKETA